MSDAFEIRRKRALFRATHRGTKEMDWMLGKYAEAMLSEMHDPALSHFELMLSVSDHQINDWLFNPESCGNPDYRTLVGEIRKFHDANMAA